MIRTSVPLASSSPRSRAKPAWMRSFCGGDAASAQAVIPGAWLTAQAKLIGILFSANGLEVIGFRHVVQERERPQQQAVHPHGVELPDILGGERRALVRREVVGGGESLRRLEIGLAAGGAAVDVPDRFLQGVKAHASHPSVRLALSRRRRRLPASRRRGLYSCAGPPRLY